MISSQRTLAYIYSLCASLFLGHTVYTAQLQLADFAFNNCSKYGEDGITTKIFEVLGIQPSIMVEIGIDLDPYLIQDLLNPAIVPNTYNGIYYSTTAHFWLDNNLWKGVIIEEDAERCTALKRLNQSNLCIINARAQDTGVAQLLINNRIPTDTIDLIAINSADTAIFHQLTVQPRVIICTIKPSDTSSLANTLAIGKQKKYKLVEIAENKAFFVQEHFYSKFNNFKLPHTM